jgi:hypothetical protein
VDVVTHVQLNNGLSWDVFDRVAASHDPIVVAQGGGNQITSLRGLRHFLSPCGAIEMRPLFVGPLNSDIIPHVDLRPRDLLSHGTHGIVFRF